MPIVSSRRRSIAPLIDNPMVVVERVRNEGQACSI
jgi:hypothetical protein